MVTTVPVSSLQTGWNQFTASTPFDYSRWSSPQNVYVNSGGAWRPLQAGETIPAGSQFQVYTAQAGALTGSPQGGGGGYGGQETVTGQDLVWQNHQIAMDLLAAQDRLRQLDQQDAALAQQAAIANAQLQAQREQAQLQYQVDVAQVGVQAAQVKLNARIAEINAAQQAADLNFRQRLSEVQEARADAQLNLQAAQTRVAESRLAAALNFDQRRSKAELQQNAAQMLADRSGPQDWVKYGYLLDNLSGPQAQASTTIDPFALLDDLVQEYTPDLTGLEGNYQSDLSGLNQPHTPGAVGADINLDSLLNQATGSLSGGGGSALGPAPQVPVPTGTSQALPAPGSGGGIAAPSTAPPTTTAPTNNPFTDPYNRVVRQPTAEWSVGVPLSALQKGWNYIASGASDTIDASRFDPSVEAYYGIGGPQGDDSRPGERITGSITGGTPFWIRRLNEGGLLDAGRNAVIAIAGDTPSGKRTGYEEAIIRTPDGVEVIDRHKTRSLLEGIDLADVPMGEGGRMARGGRSAFATLGRGKGKRGRLQLDKGPGLQLERLAGGGIVSTAGGDYDPGTITYNTYSDEDLYNQPFLRQIRGELPGRAFGAIGGGNITGRFDLPVNLSIQRYNSLLPSQRAMTKGAYDDPDAGVFFDDIVEMAKRASVGTTGFGGSSMYGRG